MKPNQYALHTPELTQDGCAGKHKSPGAWPMRASPWGGWGQDSSWAAERGQAARNKCRRLMCDTTALSCWRLCPCRVWGGRRPHRGPHLSRNCSDPLRVGPSILQPQRPGPAGSLSEPGSWPAGRASGEDTARQPPRRDPELWTPRVASLAHRNCEVINMCCFRPWSFYKYCCGVVNANTMDLRPKYK